MPKIKCINYNGINMKVLDRDKMKNEIRKIVNRRSNNMKIDKIDKKNAWDRSHSMIAIDLDDMCIRCASTSKGGYQYIFKPNDQKYYCDECKNKPLCKRCDDLHYGRVFDIVSTYKDQTNLCKLCAFDYFIKELEYTPLQFSIIYLGLDPKCNECMKESKVCQIHCRVCKDTQECHNHS